MSDERGAQGANPVDVHVGRQIRMQRRLLGMSQEHLAGALGLTFQQVQKYERGANRVSASKLYDIARALQVPISFFFAGLPSPESGAAGDPAATRAERLVREFLATNEGAELAQLFPRIPQAGVRRQLLQLVKASTDE